MARSLRSPEYSKDAVSGVLISVTWLCFKSDSQFPALGDDLADLVQVDGANIAKSFHLFNILSDDLSSALAVR
jgi:hypothetical protein